MTLTDFSRDVVPILQFVVTTVGLISLWLLWWQIRESQIWNKLNTQHSITNPDTISRLDRQVCDALKKIGIAPTDLNRNLTDDEVNKVFANDDAYFAAKALLADLENMSAALSIGVADPDYSYAVHSSRLLRAYKIFKPFIEQLRHRHNDSEIFIEFQKTAMAWQAHASQAKKLHEKKINELNEKLESLENQKGAKPKV